MIYVTGLSLCRQQSVLYLCHLEPVRVELMTQIESGFTHLINNNLLLPIIKPDPLRQMKPLLTISLGEFIYMFVMFFAFTILELYRLTAGHYLLLCERFNRVTEDK